MQSLLLRKVHYWRDVRLRHLEYDITIGPIQIYGLNQLCLLCNQPSTADLIMCCSHTWLTQAAEFHGTQHWVLSIAHRNGKVWQYLALRQTQLQFWIKTDDIIILNYLVWNAAPIKAWVLSETVNTTHVYRETVRILTSVPPEVMSIFMSILNAVHWLRTMVRKEFFQGL